MPDYKNGKIYTIRCRDDPTLIYVGSTIQKLSQRWAKHKSCSKNPNNKDYNINLYEHMRNNTEGFYIELYEDYPCENVEQLCRREGQLIREISTLNKNIAGRTKEEYKEENRENKNKYMKDYHYKHQEQRNEYCKSYFELNKDKLKEKNKEYRVINNDKIKEKKSQIIVCDCGCNMTHGNRTRHEKSKKHLDLMEAKKSRQDTEEKDT